MVAIKSAMVVKCGLVSALKAMKTMFSSQHWAIPSAGNDPTGIRKENCLQEYARVIGGRPCLFVLISIIKDGKIKLVIDEMVQRVFKGAGKDLLLKKDGDEFTLSV